jgi:hypothetical protein
MPQNWLSTNLRRVFFDMHLPDWTRPGQSGGAIADLRGVATNFDPERIIAEFVRAHINVAVVYAKCQYGNFYYNTSIGHKHTGLGDLDFLGAMTDEAHRHGIKVIGYYSNMWDTEAARAHPDWMKSDAEGRSSYKRWPALCLNSPYRDLVSQHLTEMFSNYELDGIWMDILSDLPCFCERCEARYVEKFGEPMPRATNEPNWIKFVRWQQDYLYDYLREKRELVKSIRPEAAFAINYYGTPYVAPSQGLSFKHLALSDYGSSEGYSEWHGLLFPSYVTRYMQSGMDGGPVEVLTGRFESTWDFTVRPLAQMRFEAFSIAANRGAVCIDDEPYHDGRLESLVYDHIGDIFDEIECHEPYLIGAEPVPYAALYHSQAAREVDEALRPPLAQAPKYSFLLEGNPGVSDVLPTLLGAFKAALESHLPIAFVDDRPQSLETLNQYRVVMLPNVLPLSEWEADALRAYVSQGGGLVVTGATSLYGVDGGRRDNFLLADLLGVDLVERGPFTFSYFEFHAGPLSDGLTGRALPHYSPMWRVRLNAPDLQVAATRRDPLIETSGEVYYHNNKPAPGPDSGEPAIVYRQVGKGRVVYCAGLPENNYALLGHPPYRRIIANMLRWAAGAEPPVRADGLLNTEIVVNRLGEALIVHLVTGIPQRTVYFGNRRTADSIEEPAQLSNVKLMIPPETQSVTRVPRQQPLPIERSEHSAWIVIPSLGDWETLVLA